MGGKVDGAVRTTQVATAVADMDALDDDVRGVEGENVAVAAAIEDAPIGGEADGGGDAEVSGEGALGEDHVVAGGAGGEDLFQFGGSRRPVLAGMNRRGHREADDQGEQGMKGRGSQIG